MKLYPATAVKEEVIATLHGPSTTMKYPDFPNGKLLDDLRRALRIPIRSASAALGVGDVDFYGMRQGRLIFAQDDFVAGVEALVRKAEDLYPRASLEFSDVPRCWHLCFHDILQNDCAVCPPCSCKNSNGKRKSG